MERNIVEEMARLASIARRTARYLEAFVAIFNFFSFGMGIAGSVIIAAVLQELYGVTNPWVMLLSVFIGIAIAIAAVMVVAAPVARYLVAQRLRSQRDKRVAMYSWLSFIAGFGAAYAAAAIAPAWYLNVAWYPGLAASLAVLYAVNRGRAWGVDVAAVVLATTTPIVLWVEAVKGLGNGLALGIILLTYLVAGAYALRRAGQTLLED